jgi:hypothetical protein
MATFTVSTVMATGKRSATYGVEYYVKFNESEDTFTLWFKKAPEAGQQIDGEIDGSKFKKAKKEWKPDSQNSSEQQSGTSPTARRSTYKDNSDGMRQGMCINNAANYVNALEFPKALTDREWAELVHSYATALYVLGDLKAPITEETVAAVFGGNNAD